MTAKKNKQKAAKERDWPETKLSLTPTPLDGVVLELESDGTAGLDDQVALGNCDFDMECADDVVCESVVVATFGSIDLDGLAVALV